MSLLDCERKSDISLIREHNFNPLKNNENSNV